MKEQNRDTKQYNIPTHLNKQERKLWIDAVQVLDHNATTFIPKAGRPPDDNGYQEIIRKGREKYAVYREVRRLSQTTEVFSRTATHSSVKEK